MYKILTIANKHSRKLLIFAMLFYIIIFSFVSWWKYYNYFYNSLDLAIFNQVFYNSSLGNLFQFTIHPGLYLGDHFTPIILLLVPIYYFFKSPPTLLFLQTLFLSLGAIPVYLISKEILKDKVKNIKLVSAGLSLAYLLNPFVQNMNLFEFHLLPFAIFFLLFSFYFYQRQKFWTFIIFIIFTLLAREDVALVVIMFGFLALLEKKSLKWILTPGLLGAFWFLGALKIISFFAAGGSYKFLYYYSWLGKDIPEIIINFFLHPVFVSSHLLSLGNLEMVLGLLLPFLFLPLFKPKYFLLALPPFLQIVLGAPGGSELILDTHYSALFIPALFIGFIGAIGDQVSGNRGRGLVARIIQKNKQLFIIILVVTVIYANLALGPVMGIFRKVAQARSIGERSQIKDNFVARVPEEAAVLTTYEFLTKLSSRRKIYALNYAFIGKRQFSAENYEIPETVDYLLIDFHDFVIYNLQFPTTRWTAPYYDGGGERILQIIKDGNFGIIEMSDDLALFKKNYNSDVSLYSLSDKMPDVNYRMVNKNLDNKIKFIGYQKNCQLPIADCQLSFYWRVLKNLDNDYQLKLEMLDKDNKIVYSKLYPLAYGLYPTSDWQPGKIIETNYWWQFPGHLKNHPENGDYKIRLSLVKISGGLEIDGIRSTIEAIDKEEYLGDKIIIQ